MGQKKKAEEPKNEAAKAEGEAEKKEEEDTPFIKELKELDNKYLEIEKEYETKIRELQKEYEAKQRPLLEQRAEKLAAGNESECGTPGCPGFWLEAINNYPYLSEFTREWDEPVLKYLKNIKAMDLESDPKGNSTRIEFHFAENPYFTNDVLWKEIVQDEENPWTGEQETKKITACEIEWKAGKDVTVEKKEKKVKGGGAKKAKQKGKVTEEPRDSFFRLFFRSVDPEGDEIPYLGEEAEGMMEDEDDIMEYILDQDSEVASHMKNYFVPYAVRFYTGEAEMEEDEDDDDDEDEEEEDDDDDDDDDSDDEPAPKKKGGKKKVSDDKGPSGDKKEECKQQ